MSIVHHPSCKPNDTELTYHCNQCGGQEFAADFDNRIHALESRLAQSVQENVDLKNRAIHAKAMFIKYASNLDHHENCPKLRATGSLPIDCECGYHDAVIAASKLDSKPSPTPAQDEMGRVSIVDLRDALADKELSDKTFRVVANLILNPVEVNERDLLWAKEVLEKLRAARGKG